MVDTRFYENHGPFTLAQVAEICDARVEDASKADVEVRELATMSRCRRRGHLFLL
ncbi:MAG: hypothetical protein ACLU99_04300 [Alphaproteobacteria bacterium]